MFARKVVARAWVLSLMMVVLTGLALAQDSPPQPSAAAPAALGTAFTYQGRLEDGGGPVSGTCDFKFGLFNAATDGTQIDETRTLGSVEVSEGLFTVPLDFGAGAFNGYPRWLGIEVRCPAGTGDYVTLSPRQALTPAPYALYASDAPDAMDGLSCARGQVAKWNGSAWACGDDDTGGSGGGAYWTLTGNGGTSPGTNYLGTSDDKALELKVNGQRALRLEPNSTSPNLVGGYSGNKVDAGVLGATVGGGGSQNSEQWVTDNYGTVGGGSKNRAGDADGVRTDAAYATVAGGQHNIASGAFASVGGGTGNTASGQYGTVAGGAANEATGRSAAVGGGLRNKATANYATVAGGGTSDETKPGSANWATDRWATIGGGAYNRAGTINSDTTDAEYATVGGGLQNTANARQATVAGGADNTAGYRATVGGGLSNDATGSYGTVPGGYLNVAGGSYAFAAGKRAKAIHDGAFVWADSTSADFASGKINEFAVRASGGVRFRTGGDFSIENSSGQSVFAVNSSGKLTKGTLTNNQLSFTLTLFTRMIEDDSEHGVFDGNFSFCSVLGFSGSGQGAVNTSIEEIQCHVLPGSLWESGDVKTGPGRWDYWIASDERVYCYFACF